MPNAFDFYVMKTQARLAFFVIIVLVFLVFGIMALAVIPNVKLPQEILSLITQVVTGVLGLCGIAIGYFFARHRPQTQGDNEDPLGNKTVTKQISTTETSLAVPNSQEDKTVPLVQPTTQEKI